MKKPTIKMIFDLGLPDVGDVRPVGVIPLKGRLLVVGRATLCLATADAHKLL